MNKDGYGLWLGYDSIEDKKKRAHYKKLITGIKVCGNSSTLQAAFKEINHGLAGMLGLNIPQNRDDVIDGTIVIGTPKHSRIIASLGSQGKLAGIGREGYIIKNLSRQGKRLFIIGANTEIGVLYGTYSFLQLLQTRKPLDNLDITDKPKIQLRLLNHWDNLDRTIERGYAGFSLWDWHRLPGYKDPRYTDYARANASIGINGVVLNNVNANPLSITEAYLIKAAALANIFRSYGIRVYLSVKFNSPIQLGKLKTADPLDKWVIKWWDEKVKQIYQYIPDFGGFLVKAESEGQPGPHDFGRTHDQGANMLARALKPYGGIVMWRAFVYDANIKEDRAKQAYNEFKPLDGKFESNVVIQVKNGPIDFQPREPFHPLFGTMEKTPLFMEFQITQEYLGFATHLVYLAPLFKECLYADTYAHGRGSFIANVIDGSLYGNKLTGMAGIANIGTDHNWCGHPFAQANWYAFGRLAWDYSRSSEEIARDWLKMTFTNNEQFIIPVQEMMMKSRETAVKYMTPLGLHHQMARDHHYGPGPWVNKGHADWTSTYYHRADANGIGFDRTVTGSDAVSQYYPSVAEVFSNLKSCPENLLLWFHHIPWDYKMRSGSTLWQKLCFMYQEGVNEVRSMRKKWDTLEGLIDDQRFNQVKSLLAIQEQEAIWWRDACVLYFQTFSKLPFPRGYEKPSKTLADFMKIEHTYVPGI
jgi:alpha-glucuronidase